MSALENDNHIGVFESEIDSQILGAVRVSPELIKDNGIRHVVIHGSVRTYRKVLTEAGVLDEDVEAQTNRVSQKLSRESRREIVIFAERIQSIVSQKQTIRQTGA